jgi:hypothetical protein
MSHTSTVNPKSSKADDSFFRKLIAKIDAKGHPAISSAALDLVAIHDIVLREHRKPLIRHFLLEVIDPAEARQLLGRFVSDDPAHASENGGNFEAKTGAATTAEREPGYRLHVEIAWPGVAVPGTSDPLLSTFFELSGVSSASAPGHAERTWDGDLSAPEHWIRGFGNGSSHVLVTLQARTPEAMTLYSDRLTALFPKGNAYRELWRHDGPATMDADDGWPVSIAGARTDSANAGDETRNFHYDAEVGRAFLNLYRDNQTRDLPEVELNQSRRVA